MQITQRVVGGSVQVTPLTIPSLWVGRGLVVREKDQAILGTQVIASRGINKRLVWSQSRERSDGKFNFLFEFKEVRGQDFH